jgi:hypothetical protein
MIRTALCLVLFWQVMGTCPGLAAIREYHLTIARERVVIGDKRTDGMTINGRIAHPFRHTNKDGRLSPDNA